ncbi:hypothetical protein N0V82_004821 [Gnomoniopsis sp. IMI 355080]|nr:hypothetical protein N0V82_004821 [Gnomoniopsis sp. IMI 355080]
MGSLAILKSQSAGANNASDKSLPTIALAELNDGDYIWEVLQQPGDTLALEMELEQDLRTRAEALGIPLRPHTPIRDANGIDANSPLSSHARNTSSGSNDTTDTAPTTVPSSPTKSCHEEPNLPPSPRTRPRCLTFSLYDKYLAQVEPNLNQPKFLKQTSPTADVVPNIFSVTTRKSVVSITNGIKAKVRWKKRASMQHAAMISCICCRDDFSKQTELQTLPCGHTYCGDCLRIMINQATNEESKMPPRCCTQPIPGTTIKALLVREDQQLFLKSVQQFSTPWEQRIFCPIPNCNEFIPPRAKVDPKHPFDVVCRECRTRVCTMCKMRAHPLGQDCPSDFELDQVLRIGEKSGWRRCYKCRTLVELTQGCTHMTCRCKAQFCYICGAIWDPDIGCPNICNGEEELERRRMEEAQREAEMEAEKAREEAEAAAAEVRRQEAEKRTEASTEFAALREQQEEEMQRFLKFEKKTKWKMLKRHHGRKSVLNEKYSDQTEKMRERHAKTEQHLEERQIAAEIELRASLEQAEKSVRIRVKHMEAYCKAMGRSSASISGRDADMPPRVVTERHLRELGQQHNALEGMARLHQARINVLRDRQAKRMEELLERQEKELERLDEKREEDIEDLAAEFANEEDALTQVFDERRARLVRRWELAVQILKIEMEKAKGEEYALIPTPAWPAESSDTLGSRDGMFLGAEGEERE